MSKHYDKFPPDHGTCKEYPWDAPKTLSVYPPSGRFTSFQKVMLDDENPHLVTIGGEKFMHKKVRELACKIIDAEHALVVAETQIVDMLDEGPFVPEEFGFEVIYKPDTILDAPVRVYGSRYDDRYSMHRVMGSSYGWKLLTRKDDHTFDELDIHLPCHRIAYAFFVAMDIKVEEPSALSVVLSVDKSTFRESDHVLKAVAAAPEVAEGDLHAKIKKTRKALGMDQYSGDGKED